MSSITTIYDSINTLMTTLYGSTHKHLVDPYFLEGNDNKQLARGYCFVMGQGENTDLMIGCNASIRRTVDVILTIANRGTDRDSTIRQSCEKQLFEDLKVLISSTEGNTTISDKVATFKYLSDTGIEQVYTQENSFLSIRASFEMHYIEEY